MSSFTLIDDLVDFTNELIELMKQDWKKFKIFIKEYKKYLFWIIVLLITMQFTDLMSLGSSWERYCNKTGNNNIQIGGSSFVPSDSEVYKKSNLKSLASLESKAAKAEKKAAIKAAAGPQSAKYIKNAAKSQVKAQELRKKADQAQASLTPITSTPEGQKKLTKRAAKKAAAATQATADATKATEAADKAALPEGQHKAQRAMQKRHMARSLAFGASSGSETKNVERQLGWFKSFKNRFSANVGSGAGPVFGNFDRIFQYTESLFIVVTSILLIVGVISLPVIIFLIITYCVLKTMVGKFTLL